MNYKIIGKYIKQLNFGIPNPKTFFSLSKDIANYKINLSIRVMEEQIEKEAMEKYGSKDSGASLGAILGKALGRDKKED